MTTKIWNRHTLSIGIEIICMVGQCNNDLKLVKDISDFGENFRKSNDGYFLEVDVQYPDLPFLSE